jgi:hypothetical protein
MSPYQNEQNQGEPTTLTLVTFTFFLSEVRGGSYEAQKMWDLNLETPI